MSRKTTLGAERLMMGFIVLLVVVVGLGLANGRDSRSQIPDSYLSPVPVKATPPAAPKPVAMSIPLIPVGQVVVRAAAPPRAIAEGEWLGLEVAPVTPLTAAQYGIPDNIPGLVVAEVEAQALTAGVKAGDVVLSINRAPISNMTDFSRVTRNGALTQGLVEVLRKGQKLTVNIAQTTTPPLAAAPNTAVNVPAWNVPAAPPQEAPLVAANPQGFQGPGPSTLASPAVEAFGEAGLKKPPFQEAHWQGLELIPLTSGLRRVLKIPLDAKGVIVDDVTWPADIQDFQAGDLIMSVGQIPTPTLEDFIKAADRVRDRHRAEIQLLRQGQLHNLILIVAQGRLGTANGETAPMIKPGSRPPHGYQGPCTQCHRIGTTGQLALDQGDLLSRKAPLIRAGQTPPHRDRGECTACHKIIQ